MDKQNIHTMEYSAIKNEWSCDTCHNIDEPWKHCTKWNKPHTEG